MKKLNLLLRFAETSFLFTVYINKRLSVNLFTLYCFIFQTIMFMQKENAVKVVKKYITFVCRWQQKQSPKNELFTYLLSKPLEETTFPDQPSSVYAMRDIQTELRSALQCICKTPYLDSARTDWTQISIWSAHSLDPSIRKLLEFLPQENNDMDRLWLALIFTTEPFPLTGRVDVWRRVRLEEQSTSWPAW